MEMHAPSAAGNALEAEINMLRQGKLKAEQELRKSREEIAFLRHELSQLKRLVFGARSERFEPESADQLGLFLKGEPETADEEAPVESAVVTRPKKKRKPVRQPFPSHIPRETIVLEPGVDTSGLKCIGSEVAETLDYRPSKIIVIRRERPKYVDPADEV